MLQPRGFCKGLDSSIQDEHVVTAAPMPGQCVWVEVAEDGGRAGREKINKAPRADWGYRLHWLHPADPCWLGFKAGRDGAAPPKIVTVP